MKSVALARSAAEHITTEADDREHTATVVAMEHAQPNYDIRNEVITTAAGSGPGGSVGSPKLTRARTVPGSSPKLPRASLQKPGRASVARGRSPLLRQHSEGSVDVGECVRDVKEGSAVSTASDMLDVVVAHTQQLFRKDADLKAKDSALRSKDAEIVALNAEVSALKAQANATAAATSANLNPRIAAGRPRLLRPSQSTAASPGPPVPLPGAAAATAVPASSKPAKIIVEDSAAAALAAARLRKLTSPLARSASLSVDVEGRVSPPLLPPSLLGLAPIESTQPEALHTPLPPAADIATERSASADVDSQEAAKSKTPPRKSDPKGYFIGAATAVITQNRMKSEKKMGFADAASEAMRKKKLKREAAEREMAFNSIAAAAKEADKEAMQQDAVRDNTSPPQGFSTSRLSDVTLVRQVVGRCRHTRLLCAMCCQCHVKLV